MQEDFSFEAGVSTIAGLPECDKTRLLAWLLRLSKLISEVFGQTGIAI
jgi:hypothetical protein